MFNVPVFNELSAAPDNANAMTTIGPAPPARGKDVVLGKGPNHGVGTDLGNRGCRTAPSLPTHHTRVSQRI